MNRPIHHAMNEGKLGAMLRCTMLSLLFLAAVAAAGCNAGHATRPYIVQSGGNPVHG